MSVSNWIHTRPKNYYVECVKLFGKPDAISNKKHGFAFWKTKGLFDEHILRDEDVKHCVPRNHHDYFYSSVKFFVPKNKLFDVLKISGSLNYDGLKKLLTARCGGIGANYATLYLAMMVANGKLSISQVKKNEMYPRMIRGEIIPHKDLHTIMYKLKKQNNKKYKGKIKALYADYAYDKCYKKTRKRQKGGHHELVILGATALAKWWDSSKKKTRKNKKGGGRKIKSTRNKNCYTRKKPGTKCCPHMPPDEKGRYRATNEKNKLTYKGKRYMLHTCCQMCADNMIKESKKNPGVFKRHYAPKFDKKGNMILKNKHTKKYIQTLKLLS